MLSSRSPRAALMALLAALALLAGGAAGALGAATTVTLGAPLSAFGTGTQTYEAGPVSRADASSPLGWTFTAPGKGIITQVAFFANAAGSATVKAFAVSPTTWTISAVGAGASVSPGSATTVTVPVSVPIAAGEVAGFSWSSGMGVRYTDHTGTPTGRIGGIASTTISAGTVLPSTSVQGNSMQVQYVVALAPGNTTAPSVSGSATPVVGVALSGSVGAWDSSPTAYASQWVRCDSTGASCTAITGATASTYVPTLSDVGYALRYRVTASNVEGGASDPVDSAATGVVANGIPAAYASPPIVPATAFFATASSPQPKVTLCHATASASNPYVVITVAPEAVITKGHDQHQDRRDIIPPFDYEKSGKTLTYPGLNWDARGRAIYAAGCDTPASAPVNQVLDPPALAKVTICHATASASNPYVEITVSTAAVLTQGHDQHQGRRDIIPPFSYDGGSFAGLNWDSTGRAIYEAGCREPEPIIEPEDEPADRVTICHQVGGPDYVRIVVAPQGAYNGHAKNHGRDIIPPFSFTQGRRTITFPGENWDAQGQEIFRNGCVSPPSPQPIRPQVKCIAPQADGSFTAYFGYASDDALPRDIPVGAANLVQVDALSGSAVVGAQPTTLLPGQVDVALTVTGLVQAGSASWTLTHAGVTTTATATAQSPRCPAPPGNTVTDPPNVGVYVACVTPGPNGTYSATFGYQNDDTAPLAAAIGQGNRVAVSGSDPGAQDRGQPAALAPGRTGSAFTVTGIPRARTVSWILDSAAGERVATAMYSGPRCAGAPDDSRPLGLMVSCVKGNGDGTYDATFGYANPNGVSIPVAAGEANAVSTSPGDPGPAQRGQPILFEPGSVARAFTVTSVPAGQEVTWTVAYQGTATVTAGADYATRCAGDIRDPGRDPDPPAVVIEPSLLPLGVYVECVDATRSTYSATFGYVNPNGVVIAVPVGASNSVTGGPDRGQPTEFAPGTHSAAFTVRGIPRTRSITWKVTAPDGTTATAASDPADPNCTVDPPTDTPLIDILVQPPGDPKPPTTVVDVVNPGTEIGGTPEVVIPVPPGSGPVTATSSTPGVRCRTTGARVRCVASHALLPGRRIAVRVRARTCSGIRSALGAAAVVHRPGPGATVASSSALATVGGCTSPVTG